MSEAFVFDAIRTPRGRGKSSGSLHEVKPITLLTGVLKDLQKRHDLDTGQVDDVVMGCVSPVGEQGSCIAKTAALAAGWQSRNSPSRPWTSAARGERRAYASRMAWTCRSTATLPP